MSDHKKILVADDDKNVLFLISELLARQNYQVFQAVNGEQALKEASTLHPDLIVLDIMMPLKDGIEVCQALKSTPGTDDIKIIMLTAKTSGKDIEAGIKAGADHYLTKPFRLNELTEKIRELIG